MDALARLQLEQLWHRVDHCAIGVELGGGVAGIVGELLDQILVTLAQLVLGQVRQRQLQGAELLDQIVQECIGQALLVSPLGVAKDAIERLRVRPLDASHSCL